MKRVVVVPGHSFEDPGAVNSKLGLREYDCVLEMAIGLFREDNWKDIDVILKGRNSYADLPKEINLLNPDYVIELHLNAANGKAQRTEVLYCGDSTRGKQMAEIIQRRLAEALGHPDRGVKAAARGQRGSKILWNTKAPCVIVEACFIDSLNSKKELKLDETVAALKYSIREILDRRI